MASEKISRGVGSVGDSIGSKFNQLLIGLRAKQMPKSLKRVHKSLTRTRSSHYGEATPDMLDFGPDFNTFYDMEADARLSARQSEVHDGVTMSCEYLGSTPIEEETFESGANYMNTGVSALALERIVRMCRRVNIVKCYIAITRRGFIATKQREKTTVLNIPIERVLFLCADVKYKKIVVVVARNMDTQRVECMALLCESVKKAGSMCSAMYKSYEEHKSRPAQPETAVNHEEFEIASPVSNSQSYQSSVNGAATRPNRQQQTGPLTHDRDSGYLSHAQHEPAGLSLSYVPPSLSYVPPSLSYVPPSLSYVPPNLSYVPPSLSYVPPNPDGSMMSLVPEALSFHNMVKKSAKDDLVNLDLAQPTVSYHQPDFMFDRPSSKHSQSVDDLLFDVMRDREPEPTLKVESAHQPNDFTTVSTVADFSKSHRDKDLELEFSSFARSRSQADLTNLKPMVQSGWDI